MREVCEVLMCGGSSGNSNMQGFNPAEGGGDGEVRRLNVVYFLSRDGRIDHPHLIRVHHFYRHGVHLHDVKRWLADLRGKDMPESYAWSYKRRYKTGYVWQDLKDDDLITPISDNEYVLKGSFLHNSSSCVNQDPELENTAEDEEKAAKVETKAKDQETLQIELDEMVSPKPPPQLDLDSPVLEEPAKLNLLYRSDAAEGREEKKDRREPWLKKSSSSRKVLMNLFSCKETQTVVDWAQKPINKDEEGNYNDNHNENPKNAKCEHGEKAFPASYHVRQFSETNCMQCEKIMKPEKLRSHRRSSKASKGHRRSISDIEKVPLRIEPHSEEFS